MAFDVQHDCREPLGFLIKHPEMGLCLFATDTYYLKYNFSGLNQIIIEANYCEEILESRGSSFIKNRVIESHMSLQTCKKYLQNQDLSKVHNIVLIHLSDGNSDERKFNREIDEITTKKVSVASAGMILDFNLTPF